MGKFWFSVFIMLYIELQINKKKLPLADIRTETFLVNLLGAKGVITRKLLLFNSTGCLSSSLTAYNFTKLFKACRENGVWLLKVNVIFPLPGFIVGDLETLVSIRGLLSSHLKRMVDGSMFEIDSSRFV